MAFTVPGLSQADGQRAVEILQSRLSAYNDLHLTLKHAHWNVVGPNFIGVHEMIDPQVDLVRGYADAVAERIAALGGTPLGTTASIIDPIPYPLGRGSAQDHLAALDKVYDKVVAANRKAMEAVEFDLVSQDLLIGETAELEKFQWFMRSHFLENFGG
ncbi:MAG: DNA starvation/stationary phase protection protein [Propionibacteriaceae bacterium]|jgi:starvation-inducible DNA-binding protein|nr:DNA starvation/stationary phase protection protein [Propionibacteriaceae bacterium]